MFHPEDNVGAISEEPTLSISFMPGPHSDAALKRYINSRKQTTRRERVKIGLMRPSRVELSACRGFDKAFSRAE
jgi:hypothetical protein